MSSQSIAKKVIWARRLVQVACLSLFVWLVWYAGVHDAEEPVPSWVRAFFYIDPLILIGTWMASHALPTACLLALVTVGVTVLLGRVFCGWVCPLGTVHNGATWFRRYAKSLRRRTDPWSPWQRTKYLLLVALLIMAAFGSHWIGVFDPLSLLYRTTATVLAPGAQYAVEDAATAVYQADPHLGPLKATSITEPSYRFLRDHVFVRERPVFLGATLMTLVFVGIVLLNLYRPRFWCRYVCPLGALLGLCAKRSALRLVEKGGCVECGRCAMQCPAAASPEKPGGWRSTECLGCWNCVAVCHKDAITFGLKAPTKAPAEAQLDVSKRATLCAGLTGAGALVMMRLNPEAQAQVYNPALIRPPGALDEREFLKRCVKCGACMRVCPTNALHPTGLEAGLEGIWTPRLVPRLGYCEYNCNLCGQTCPTEAIEPLSLEKKQEVKLGLATFDRSRCLPFAYGRTCLICEEHCPTSPKAIRFVSTEVELRGGKKVVLKQPVVDPELCIGCGICESVCVFKDRPAVRVTSANETRHLGNQPILPSSEIWPDPSSLDAYENGDFGPNEASGDPYS